MKKLLLTAGLMFAGSAMAQTFELNGIAYEKVGSEALSARCAPTLVVGDRVSVVGASTQTD